MDERFERLKQELFIYRRHITGHRPTRFRFKYDEKNNGCKRIKKRIRDQLVILYEQGARQFWVGGHWAWIYGPARYCCG